MISAPTPAEMRPARASDSFSVTSTPTGSRSHCRAETPASPSWSQPAGVEHRDEVLRASTSAVVVAADRGDRDLLAGKRPQRLDQQALLVLADSRFCDCARSSSATLVLGRGQLLPQLGVLLQHPVGRGRRRGASRNSAVSRLRRSRAVLVGRRLRVSCSRGRSRRQRARPPPAAPARTAQPIAKNRLRNWYCADVEPLRPGALAELPGRRIAASAATSASRTSPASCTPPCSRMTVSSESHPGMTIHLRGTAQR